MNISINGLNLIKKYEGLRLTAYKPVSSEKYYTIGYGHYGADVTADMCITESKATEYLKEDVKTAEKAVTSLLKYYDFTQNQFDALVSFTFNCGKGNLTKLTKNHTRTIEEIAEHITAYNKDCNGRVLQGLVRRRNEELKLYNLSSCLEEYYPKYTGTSLSINAVFKSIGVESEYIGDYKKRKPIALKNGYGNYRGSALQNLHLIELASEGLLKRV